MPHLLTTSCSQIHAAEVPCTAEPASDLLLLKRYSPACLTAAAAFEAASETASGAFWLVIESPAARAADLW